VGVFTWGPCEAYRCRPAGPSVPGLRCVRSATRRVLSRFAEVATGVLLPSALHLRRELCRLQRVAASAWQAVRWHGCMLALSEGRLLPASVHEAHAGGGDRVVCPVQAVMSWNQCAYCARSTKVGERPGSEEGGQFERCQRFKRAVYGHRGQVPRTAAGGERRRWRNAAKSVGNAMVCCSRPFPRPGNAADMTRRFDGRVAQAWRAHVPRLRSCAPLLNGSVGRQRRSRRRAVAARW